MFALTLSVCQTQHVKPPAVVHTEDMQKSVSCNCKKSRCLKMYCDCFRLMVYCQESCNCNQCANLVTSHACIDTATYKRYSHAAYIVSHCIAPLGGEADGEAACDRCHRRKESGGIQVLIMILIIIDDDDLSELM
jgi:hypothetical protein